MISFEAIKLKKISPSDREFVRKVRNQSSSRTASFQSSFVKKDEHQIWFNRTLKDTTQLFFTIERKEKPAKIGTLRMNRINSNTAEIHIALLENQQGKGYGSEAIQAALQKVKDLGKHVHQIVAHIKTTNPASIHLFKKHGFTAHNRCIHLGHSQTCVTLSWEQRNVLFVVDLGKQIGLGHLMREKTLSESLGRLGHKSLFFIRENRSERIHYRSFLNQLGLHSISENQLKSLVQKKQIHCVIIDTLQLPSLNLIDSFMDQNIPIALIGNYLKIPSWASLCFNPYTQPQIVSKKTRCYLSPKYSIVSPVFQSETPFTVRDKAKQLFILPGGGNTDGMIFKILEALKNLPRSIKMDVVVGKMFTHDQKLRSSLGQHSKVIRLWKNISSEKIADLMNKSDLAILSYGRSLDEARSLRVPALILSSSDLNRSGALHAEKQGGIRYIGDIRHLTPEMIRKKVTTVLANVQLRRRLSQKSSQLMDAKGVERVASILINSMSVKS